MNEDITDRYLPFLEKVLTPKRLKHSLGVMQVMGELAGVYGLNRQQALAAGLLHDAAKDLPPEQIKTIRQQAKIEIRWPCDDDYVLYLHGPVGAAFVRQELGLDDPLILEAINLHTFSADGEYFDHPLVWCLRFSDILEPNRNWSMVRVLRKGAGRLRETVFAGRLAEGAFLQTGWLIRWFEEIGYPVHPNIYRAHQALSAQLNLDDHYLD